MLRRDMLNPFCWPRQAVVAAIVFWVRQGFWARRGFLSRLRRDLTPPVECDSAGLTNRAVMPQPLPWRQQVLAAALVFCAASGLRGQDATSPVFEVASIKASAPPDANGAVFVGTPRGGPGTPDPGQITWSGATLMSMLTAAYEVKPYQVAGPDWLRADEERYRYDIAVKVPAGATKEQVPAMWRDLLKDRFGMSAHTESRQFAADELIVGKGGSKLRDTTLDPNGRPPAGRPRMGPDGLPQLERPGIASIGRPGPNGIVSYLVARATPMSTLARFLTNQLGHPVTDKTGMAGSYDFVLEYRPDMTGRFISPALAAPTGADSAAEPGTDIETALEQQLGLRLVKGKAPLQFVVVDHMEKTPSSN